MKVLFLLPALLASAINVTAQSSPIRPLTVGDTVPDIEFTSLMNYHSKTARLSDFGGKLVIVDLLATWCSPCVAVLPKYQKLQDEFGENVQIIAVTLESRNIVEAFFRKNKAVRETPSIPWQPDDSVISKMFPFKMLSHLVWIGADRKVKAITGSDYVKSGNIKKILENEPVDWPVKQDFSSFSAKEGIFESSSQANVHSAFYSGFSSYIQGGARGLLYKSDSANKQIRYNQYNFSIPELYAIGYGDLSEFLNPKRFVLAVADSSKYFYNPGKDYHDTWIRENSYCYEARAPITYSDDQLRERLVSDLDFFFMLESKIEDRLVTCLILKRLSKPNPMPSKPGIPNRELSILSNGGYSYFQKNSRLADFLFSMNYDLRLNKLPLIIDETDFDETLDLNITIGKDLSVDSLRKALNAYGFDLVVESRRMSMLILTEK